MVSSPGYYGVLAPDTCELDDLIGPEWCEEEELKPVREVITRVLASVMKEKRDNKIILDTAASKSLFKNEKLLSDIHDIDPVEITSRVRLSCATQPVLRNWGMYYIQKIVWVIFYRSGTL